MDQTMKKIVDVLNAVPKANLNYAMDIYDRYTKSFDDGIFELKEDGSKEFILPFILKTVLGNVGPQISEKYFEELEKFFTENYQQDFLLKTDLFLQVMAEKTRKHFSIEGGNEKVAAGTYSNMYGLSGEFELKTDKTKTEIVMDIVNLYLSEYVKKILFVRVYIIYNIILILEKYDYSTELTDEEIFTRVNNDLKETFMSEANYTPEENN